MIIEALYDPETHRMCGWSTRLSHTFSNKCRVKFQEFMLYFTGTL